jgi:hypothetical protein
MLRCPLGSKAAQPTLNADFRFAPERGQAAAVDSPNAEMSYRRPPLWSYTFDPVSQGSPLVTRSGDSRRERGSRTTAQAARVTARWTAEFWLLV